MLENKIYGGRSSQISEVVVPYSADFVQEHIGDVHLAIRRELAKANLLDLNSGPKIHLFTRINDLTGLENAVKSACRHLIQTYAKDQFSSKNPN